MDDLEQIIADQMAQIEQLTNENAQLLGEIEDLSEREDSEYWQGVYDNIRAAWDKWALAELGTASPSPLDLQGRPELASLWEAVR
jgi:cell division protein FtsB